MTVSPSFGALIRTTNGLPSCIGARRSVAPFAVDAERAPLGLRLLAARGQFLGRQEAAIGMAALDQRVGDLGMARGPLELEHRRFVAVEAKPGQAVENRVDRRLGRAGAVGILDTKQILAAVMAGEQPVEQGSARTADMKIAGR